MSPMFPSSSMTAPSPTQPPGPFPLATTPPAQQPLITGMQSQQNPIAQPQEITLPRPENKISLRSGDISIKRLNNHWQLWVGQRMLRDFGDREMDARDAFRVYQDIRPTEWVTIGSGKPYAEYGLFNGRSQMAAATPNPAAPNNSLPIGTMGGDRPVVTGAGARQVLPIDLRTARLEAVRGVWCLRDDYNIHINFGLNKADGEQTLAAIRKYGFNRLGIVGNPTPAMTYLFAAADTGVAMPKGPFVQANLQLQIDNLSPVGIPVAGLGYVGEMVRFDPQKLELRKDGSDYVIVAGSEILGRYGASEWIARDALRAIQDSRFTEFCKMGSAGITFFLADGRAPTRVPFSAQGRQFDLNSLKVRKNGEHWAVTDNGRYLFDCASPEEGDTLIRVMQFYQFDQLCHIGPTTKLGVSFFARTH